MRPLFVRYDEESKHSIRRKARLLQELAVKYEASPGQDALNCLIHTHGETVFAIPGASRPHHALENVKAMRFTLEADEITELASVSSFYGR